MAITLGPYSGTHAGQGGFATVYRVTGPEQRPYALKIANEDADDATKDSLYHEFIVQSELTYPQVIHAHEFGLHDGRPYIVLDWIEGATFFDRIGNPDEDDFLALLEGMSRTLLFVHHRGWVHGDLKPDNFIWRTPGSGDTRARAVDLCLLDFGLARPVGDVNRPRGAGTVGYCAPEFLRNLPADGRADWYAVGIILYEWIFGVRPYADEEPAAELAGHLEGVPNFDAPQFRRAPEWAITVIERLLAKSADERGEDEHALMTWLAQFDSRFEPAAILNEQLPWHARSESLRLRESGSSFLKELTSDLNAGCPANWVVYSHGLTSDALIRRTRGLCASLGYSTSTDSRADSSYVICDGAFPHGADSRIHLTIRQDLRTSTERQPISLQRSITILPWDRLEVRSYLRAVVGDEDVAEAWATTILNATCGLPRAVAELLEHLLATSAMSVDGDGWGIEEAAIASWCKSNITRHVELVFGALSEPELTLCEWLALAEGRGATGILRTIWPGEAALLEDVCGQLVERGLVVREFDSGDRSFDLRLRLPGHDAHLRAGMALEAVEQRSRTLAVTLESSPPNPVSVCAGILANAFARASDWEKSATYGLRAATIAIKAEDRERAMHYIGMAKESASRIENLAARSHLIGQARMVEGDLQKAAGQLEAARQIYRELLALCRMTGDQRLLAETLHDLGDLYRIMRVYDKGIRAEGRARRIWELLGDRAELSRSLNSLGNFCRIASDMIGARNYYTQALEIQRELGLDQFAATNLNNIGLTYWQEFNFAEAESHFRQALSIQERLNVPVEIARVFNNLGAISFVQGHLNEATGHFVRAASLNAEAGAGSEELYNRRNLIEVAIEQGDLRSAVTMGQQVVKGCRELGDLSTLAEVSALLADAYFRAGDYRSALRAYRETRDLSASIRNDELTAYLDVQLALRHHRFQRPSDAIAILDVTLTSDQCRNNRYQYLDAVIARVLVATSLGDDETASRLWSEGITISETIRAPHKAAQLALAMLGDKSGTAQCRELTDRIDSLLREWPRWHWEPAYRIWQARQLQASGELDVALELVTATSEQLRRDGCWEVLWRALVAQGSICHAQADYEPAMRHLDEAVRMLKIVAATVDDDGERSAYADCDDVRTLEATRERISDLVAG